MVVCKTRLALVSILSKFYSANQSIGFVPTMGALHEGHLSLVETAKDESNVVVCSIFVNPTQFNDPKDLEKYPRPTEHDIELLEKANCDVLFLPEVEEIYTGKEQWSIDLDGLDQVLEGKTRPGHYQGVTQVVKILFDIVAPTKAFFGQKDYQQLLVIRKMVAKLGLNVKLVMCPTVREEDGLAMSSRNVRLSELERKNALALYRALQLAQSEFSSKSIQQITADATHYLRASPGIDLDYFQICDGLTLMPTTAKQVSLVALVAAQLGQTRLIDNIILEPV